MKKYSILLILSISLFLWGCQKETITITKISSGSSASVSDSYQPTTKSSYWKYHQENAGTIDTSTITMTGATTTINGKKYYLASGSSHTFPSSTGYYHTDNHQLTVRATSLGNITAEFYFLNDTMAVNHTWISNFTDDGYVNGIPARIVGKVLEKGVSITVSGKTFANVIHTQLDLQYDYGLGDYSTAITYHYYVAKGIGTIKTETTVGGISIGISSIIEYSIK